jgi:hypothetical protein
MRRTSTFVSMVLFKVALLVPAHTAWAQATATTGQIEGVIVDETGAAIPGATVTATNVNTGFERFTVTENNGLFRLSLLPLGPYNLKSELPGFSTVDRTGLALHVGETLSVNVTMKVASVQETVVVTASSPLVEVTRSRVANIINDTSLGSLPINGRRFQDFLLLTPGAVVESQRGGTSINGQRGINAGYSIDGADYGNPFFGGIKGGERSNLAYTISQEAISEFQVSNSGYSAEFGRSGGGVMNAVTKSGTNAIHGSAFWFFQNQSMVADDPFGNAATDFKRHQFGASIGGPIQRDRVHYFFAYDQQVRDNPLFIQFPSDPTNVPRFGDTGTFVQDGNVWKDSVNQTNDIWTAFARVDLQAGAAHHLWARYNFSKNEAIDGTNTGTTDRANTNNGLEEDRTDTAVVQLSSVLSGTTLNEVRFQYGREDRPRTPNTLDPTMTVTGFGTAGRVTFLPSLETDYRYQIVDNYTWLKGDHSFRAGTDLNWIHIQQPFFLSRAGGEYRFNSLADYQATIANPLQPRYRDFRQGFGRADVDFWQQEYAFYLQDTWKLRSNLTLNYGLRYEMQLNPALDEPNPELPQTIPDDLAMWGPRGGVSWDPWNDNKSVVRFNAGLFYSRTPGLLLVSPFTTNGIAQVQLTFTPTTPGAPIFPNVLPAPPTGSQAPRSDVNIFQDDARNPRTFQTSLGIERQLAPGLTVGVDGVYVKMTHLERLFDANLPLPARTEPDGRLFYVTATNPRPNPNFNRILRAEDTARGDYWGLTLTGRKVFSGSGRWYNRGSQFQAFYTYARNKDDDSNERNFSGTFYQDWVNLGQEFTWSNNDIRHNLTANATWQFSGDVQVGAILQAHSGVPYSRTATTIDLNGNGTFDDDRQFVNGIDTGRNAFRQPDYYRMDLRLTKIFRFGGRSADASLDLFNLFNADNEFVNSTNRNFVNNPSVGVPNEQYSSSGPRAAQVSLRFRF